MPRSAVQAHPAGPRSSRPPRVDGALKRVLQVVDSQLPQHRASLLAATPCSACACWACLCSEYISRGHGAGLLSDRVHEPPSARISPAAFWNDEFCKTTLGHAATMPTPPLAEARLPITLLPRHALRLMPFAPF